MITYKKENEKLKRKLSYEEVKVKNRDELIYKQAEANKELRQDCEDFTEAYRKIMEQMSKNQCGSATNLQNTIKTILADCNLDKYRVCK